ncbi:MAG: hypothetical protein GX455_15345 [Phycisphaerae bacterium]|nr:hypothetical protein [Phycisphaerae bacterium]
MQNPSIPICESDAIARAYEMLSVEMGHVAAATAIYEQIIDHYGSERARWFLKANGRAFPILAAMADEDGANRIRKRIHDITIRLSALILNKTDIVCIGAEAAWLDMAAPMHLDKVFHVVPHSGDADLDRFLSNYGDNVRIHDSVNLSHLYGTTSVIVTFAFGVTEHTFYTYPVTCRICGQDIRQAFSELIALDMIDCPLRFYPNDLVEIATDEMTHVLTRSRESIRRTVGWKSAAF